MPKKHRELKNHIKKETQLNLTLCLLGKGKALNGYRLQSTKNSYLQERVWQIKMLLFIYFSSPITKYTSKVIAQGSVTLHRSTKELFPASCSLWEDFIHLEGRCGCEHLFAAGQTAPTGRAILWIKTTTVPKAKKKVYAHGRWFGEASKGAKINSQEPKGALRISVKGFHLLPPNEWIKTSGAHRTEERCKQEEKERQTESSQGICSLPQTANARPIYAGSADQLTLPQQDWAW